MSGHADAFGEGGPRPSSPPGLEQFARGRRELEPGSDGPDWWGPALRRRLHAWFCHVFG